MLRTQPYNATEYKPQNTPARRRAYACISRARKIRAPAEFLINDRRLGTGDDTSAARGDGLAHPSTVASRKKTVLDLSERQPNDCKQGAAPA